MPLRLHALSWTCLAPLMNCLQWMHCLVWCQLDLHWNSANQLTLCILLMWITKASVGLSLPMTWVS